MYVLDEAVTSGDRGRRGSAVPLALSPLSIIIPESSQEEPSLSRGDILTSYEIYFTVLLNYSRFGSSSVFSEPVHHRNSWMERPLPPPAHQIDNPWFFSELLATCWWSEFLGPSVFAPPPVKSRLAHRKTLIWLGVPFSGLGPRYQEQLTGPTPLSLKIHSKGCGPTFKALKPNDMIKIEAHLPSVPRSVYFISLSSPILFMLFYAASVGRRLHPSSILTSLDWIDSYHSRGLMENLTWVSSEDSSLLKKFLYPLSSTIEKPLFKSCSLLEKPSFPPSSYMERTPSSYMERTLATRYNLWLPVFEPRKQPIFHTILLLCVEILVPARFKVLESSSTSLCQSTVTNISPPEMLVEVPSTHQEFVCANMLYSYRLQVLVDLKSYYLIYLCIVLMNVLLFHVLNFGSLNPLYPCTTVICLF